MKICEIDEQDKTYAATKGIDLNIDISFNNASYILGILVRSKSAKRNSQYLSTIADIEIEYNWILEQTFADDESTKELKEKVKYYLDEIQRMKGLL